MAQVVESYAWWVLRWRWPILIITVAATILAARGGAFLSFSTDYRAYFGKDNPQLATFEALQANYAKNDNILFVIAPADGQVFTGPTLDAIERLTRAAWKLPYAMRVDSVTNFQHTRADGDDLVVADLVAEALTLSPEDLLEARRIALREPLLRNRLISPSAHVTGVNVTLQLPGEGLAEVAAAVAKARQLADQMREAHPDLAIYLTGVTLLNNAFSESSQRDMSHLLPLMYAAMLIIMFWLLRSVSGAVATLLVIGFSAAGAMGLGGWMGLILTGPPAQAPTMIMTLAVADSVHILMTMLSGMRQGLGKNEALVESLRINMQPVFLTSLTTVIGFLSMNFSDTPPLRHLGNLTATGVGLAFAHSALFLPALMSLLPVRVKPRDDAWTSIDRLAAFVVRRHRPLLWASGVVVLALALCIPRNELNDQFVNYFDKSTVFRTDTDFAMQHLSGIYSIEYSLGAADSGGISDPAYLATLDAFAAWYRAQPGVAHVNTLSDTMKRLNMNLHGDDPNWRRLPDERELAAQYLLLYEMSLPYGLDLNNQINIDKSATRFIATLENVTARELRDMAARSEAWLRDHAPASMFTHGTSPTVMFAYISERNIKSALRGAMIALVLISALLIAALRSLKYGLISLLPNLAPALLSFGVWGLLVGQINLGLSVVMGMTLGIVVDDTVHFLSKYLRARRDHGLSAEDAARYAFSSVGAALVVTSAILMVGFLVAAQSSFQINAAMGQLTAITIAFALLADLLTLPALLMWIDVNIRAPSLGPKEPSNA